MTNPSVPSIRRIDICGPAITCPAVAVEVAVNHISKSQQAIVIRTPGIAETYMEVLCVWVYKEFQRWADQFLAVSANGVAHIIGARRGACVPMRGGRECQMQAIR